MCATVLAYAIKQEASVPMAVFLAVAVGMLCGGLNGLIMECCKSHLHCDPGDDDVFLGIG